MDVNNVAFYWVSMPLEEFTLLLVRHIRHHDTQDQKLGAGAKMR